MSEIESFDEALDHELEKTAGARIGRSRDALNLFLQPPYTFALPDSSKKLDPGDLGYKHYMCRNNNITLVVAEIGALLLDPQVGQLLSPEDREFLDDKMHGMRNMTLAVGNQNKTPDDMLQLEQDLRAVVEGLGQLSPREQSDSPAAA